MMQAGEARSVSGEVARDVTLPLVRSEGSRLRPGTKVRVVAEMLLRPQGASHGEICAALGWRSISVPWYSRRYDLAVTRSREGRRVRWCASASNDSLRHLIVDHRDVDATVTTSVDGAPVGLIASVAASSEVFALSPPEGSPPAFSPVFEVSLAPEPRAEVTRDVT